MSKMLVTAIIINYTNTLFQYLNKKCEKVLKVLTVVFATYYNGVMDVSLAFSKVLLLNNYENWRGTQLNRWYV